MYTFAFLYTSPDPSTKKAVLSQGNCDAAVNFDRYAVCRQLFSTILLQAVDTATLKC